MNILQSENFLHDSQYRLALVNYIKHTKLICIDIYVHSCLKRFSFGRKTCSNSKTHVQIMKFTCRLNMGFGGRHWSMRRDVKCFVETKWPTLKNLHDFRRAFFYVVNVIFMRF